MLWPRLPPGTRIISYLSGPSQPECAIRSSPPTRRTRKHPLNRAAAVCHVRHSHGRLPTGPHRLRRRAGGKAPSLGKPVLVMRRHQAARERVGAGAVELGRASGGARSRNDAAARRSGRLRRDGRSRQPIRRRPRRPANRCRDRAILRYVRIRAVLQNAKPLIRRIEREKRPIVRHMSERLALEVPRPSRTWSTVLPDDDFSRGQHPVRRPAQTQNSTLLNRTAPTREVPK